MLNQHPRAAPLVLAGLAAGTFLTGLALSALHLSPLHIDLSGSSELIAAIIGAVIGGGISIAGTYFFQSSERKLTQTAQAHRLIMTASLMHSDIANIRRHATSNLDPALWPIQLWSAIKPAAGRYEPRRFEQTDLSLLIAAKEFDLVAALVEMEMWHQSVCDGWNEYGITRRALAEFMPVTATSGTSITSNLDPKNNPAAILRTIEADSLIKNLLKYTDEVLPKFEATNAKLGPAFKRYFRASEFLGIAVN